MQQDNIVMDIKKSKNLIGLCACVECKNKMSVLITLEKKRKDKPNKVTKRFFVCQDHAWEIASVISKKYK